MGEDMDDMEMSCEYRELIPFVNTIQNQHKDIIKNSKKEDISIEISCAA